MVRRMNLREQLLDELGQRIVKGELEPNDTLPKEADLSEEYGVSRTIIREAIKGLQARGLVESKARVGTTVRPRKRWKLLDPDVLRWSFESNRQAESLLHLTEVRYVLEPAAAQWAAQRATQEEIAHIKTCFHDLEATILLMEQANTEDTPDPYVAATEEALELHRVPFEAIMERNGDAARQGMRAILEWVMTVIERFFEQSGNRHVLHS